MTSLRGFATSLSRALAIAVLAFASPAFTAPWGVAAEFADWSPAQSEYEAPVLAQRGVGCVFLNMHGTQRNWPNWVKVQEAWRAAKVDCIWDLPACVSECERIYGMLPGVLNIDDRALLGNGGRAYLGSDPRLGNFLSATLANHTQRVAQTMAMRLERPQGYRVTANAEPGDGSYDKDALASWQALLRRFFSDDSPARDMNGDTSTFNSAFGTSYKTWADVPQFTSKQLSESRNRRLADLWLADAYAGFVADLSGCVYPLAQSGSVGPGVRPSLIGASDASLLASRKTIGRLFCDSPEGLPLADSIAAAFGKRAFACPVQLVPGDLSASRQRAMKLLPYSDGALFDYANLVARRDAPLGERPANQPEPGFDENGNVVAPIPVNGPPAKIEAFDPAFQVIPELAPFAGAFRAERAPVLWIVSSDREKKDLGCVLDAYCVSEGTLALYPDSVDLTRYKAVIYASTSPCVSTVVLQRLFEYAVKGGAVFIDAWRIADGLTLHGREQSRFWWEMLKVGRDASGQGETTISYAGGTWALPSVAPHLTSDSERIIQSGRVTDSTGASYPLVLTRRMGSAGKWVFVNVPGVWKTHFDLLREIVKAESGISLPDPTMARVYSGPNCALAVGGEDAEEVAIPCQHEQAAAFDIVSRKVYVGRPANGLLRLPEKLGPGEARLWVVKPFSKPVVLHTDGTMDHAASIADGVLKDNVLAFRFAERAYVSSPERPKSLTVDGKPAEFDYDPVQRLVTITRTGGTVDAGLAY